MQTEQRTLALVDGSVLNYDYLVLATGARHSYFGRDEWETLAPGLKSLEDAEEIRRRVLLSFERAERETDPVKRHAHLTFVVVGGGPTGVEVAGALAEIRRLRPAARLPAHRPARSHGDAARRRTPDPAELPCRAVRARQARAPPPWGRGAGARRWSPTSAPDWFRRAGWTIPTQTVVWAAGNVASPLTAHSRRATRSGRPGDGRARLHHPRASGGLRPW